MEAYDIICSEIKLSNEKFRNIKKKWAEEITAILNDYAVKIAMLNDMIEYVAGIDYLPSNLNFRDALFHYKIAYEADNIITLIEQNNSIQEHLHRAIKDGITVIIRSIIKSLDSFYQEHAGEMDRRRDLLIVQNLMHEYKNKEMEMRLNSLEIQRSFENDEYLTALIKLNKEAKERLSDTWFSSINKKIFEMADD